MNSVKLVHICHLFGRNGSLVFGRLVVFQIMIAEKVSRLLYETEIGIYFGKPGLRGRRGDDAHHSPNRVETYAFVRHDRFGECDGCDCRIPWRSRWDGGDAQKWLIWCVRNVSEWLRQELSTVLDGEIGQPGPNGVCLAQLTTTPLVQAELHQKSVHSCNRFKIKSLVRTAIETHFRALEYLQDRKQSILHLVFPPVLVTIVIEYFQQFLKGSPGRQGMPGKDCFCTKSTTTPATTSTSLAAAV